MKQLYTQLSYTLVLLLTVCSYNTYAQVYEQNGQIVFSINGDNKTISTGTNNSLPLLIGNEVYFVSNPDNGGGTVMVYDTKAQQRADLIRHVAHTTEYNFKDRIANMMAGDNNTKLYFSTVSISPKGVKNYVTWLYDISTKNLSSYKDGLIEYIDGQGKQTIIFYGLDYKGSYKRKSVYTRDGTLDQNFDKEYTVSNK